MIARVMTDGCEFPDAFCEGLLAVVGDPFRNSTFDLPCELRPELHLLDGPEGHDDGASIRAVLAIVDRVVPFCKTYICKQILSNGKHQRGLYLCEDERELRCIVIAMHGLLPDVMATAYHECYHACEHRLSDDCIDAIDAVVAQSCGWPGNYYSEPAEKRARLFQHWAMACEHGWGPTMVGGSIAVHVDRIFADLYSGVFGRMILARDTAPPAPARKTGLWSRIVGRASG